MPMRVIGMLLGIPEDDQQAIRDQTDSGLHLDSADDYSKAFEEFSGSAHRRQLRRVPRLADGASRPTT